MLRIVILKIFLIFYILALTFNASNTLQLVFVTKVKLLRIMPDDILHAYNTGTFTALHIPLYELNTIHLSTLHFQVLT